MTAAKRSILVWTSLLLMGAIIFAERVYTYDEPLDRDIAGYALIGHEMLGGRSLYSDIWDRKPPLLYGSYAAAEWLVGFGQREVMLLNVLAAGATLVAVYGCGSAKGTPAGLLAAGLWTLLCTDLPMQANQPNAEVFINAFMTGAVALLLRWPDNRDRRRAVIVGVLMALATMYKHHVIVIAVAVLMGHVLARGRAGRRERFIEALCAMVSIAAVWGAVCVYFASIGDLWAMVDVLFFQDAAYAGNPVENLWQALAQRIRLLPEFMAWAIQPLLLTAASVLCIASWKRDRQWAIWFAWAIATWVAVALPGKLFAHYYQYWLPVLCVSAGWSGAMLLRSAKSLRWLSIGLVAEVLIGVAVREARFFTLPPAQWTQLKYPDDNLLEQHALGLQLRELLTANQRIWVLGEDTPIYFYARHFPVTSQLFNPPLMENGGTPTAWNQLMNDLHASPPDVVVLSRFWVRFVRPDAPVFAWLRENYQPSTGSLGQPGYVILLRRSH